MKNGIKIKNIVDFSPIQYKVPDEDVKYGGCLITSSQLSIIDNIKNKQRKEDKLKIHNQSNLDFLNIPGMQNSLDNITNLSINNDYKGNKLKSALQISLYFRQLVQLDISFNNLDCISDLFNIVSLKRVIAQDNLITSINGIEKLSNLQYLDLTRNNIYDINVLSQCKNLQILKLGQNYVRNIVPILKCKQLRTVEVYANPISRNSYIFMLLLPNLKQVQFSPTQVTNKNYNYLSDFNTYKDYLVYMEKSHLKYYFSFSECKLLDIRQQQLESIEEYTNIEQYNQRISKLKTQIQKSFGENEITDLSKELETRQKKRKICIEFQMIKQLLDLSKMILNMQLPQIKIQKLDVKL